MGLGKALSKLIFNVYGWKLEGEMPPGLTKCIMVAAPHTSNWDFIFSRAAFYLMEVPVRFTIKSEFMKFPFGWLLKRMGALPVNRSKNNSLVQGMAKLLQEADELVILVTPEGTRKYQPRWRKGFYYAAMEANVPIVLGFLDYKHKIPGNGPVIYPTGNMHEDIEKIMTFYRTKQGKFPENGVR